MFDTFNLFPESRFFRVKGEAEMHHNCGLFSSMLIIIACIAILAYKLVELFNRTTILFTTNTKVDLIPPFTTISTFQNDTQFEPYMLAIVTKVIDTTCPAIQAPSINYIDTTNALGSTVITL
jgi:hypothetical protein